MQDIIPVYFKDMGDPAHEPLDNDSEKLFSLHGGEGAGATDTWSALEDTKLGIYAGFWGINETLCDVNYKEWEYFHFLEGEAIITNKEGKSWMVDNKHGVIIPSGFRGTWKTTKKILKKYVIVLPDAGLEKNYDPNHIIILDRHGLNAPSGETEPTPKEKMISDGTMATETWDFYHDDNSIMIDCGNWRCEVGKRHIDHTGYWEFCHLLEGEAVLGNGDGKEWRFKAGDGFIIPMDFKGTWETVKELVKDYVILTPK